MKSGKSPVLFLLSFLAASAACSRNTAYVRVRLEVPTAPAVKVADYREIAVAGFCLPEPSTDVDLDQDLSAFFEAELKIRSGAAVSRRRLTLDDEALLGQERPGRDVEVAPADPAKRGRSLADKLADKGEPGAL